MFANLIVMLIKLWIKKNKKIRVFLVSIDYYKYFKVVSIIPFFFSWL